MALSVVGSLYDIPEPDLLNFINAQTGATWVATNAHIESVTANVVDGVTVSIRVAVETGE